MTSMLTTPRSDEKLALEAAQRLAKLPQLQLVAELLSRLRDMSFPWWTPQQLREVFRGSGVAVREFEHHAHFRERIVAAQVAFVERADQPGVESVESAHPIDIRIGNHHS